MQSEVEKQFRHHFGPSVLQYFDRTKVERTEGRLYKEPFNTYELANNGLLKKVIVDRVATSDSGLTCFVALLFTPARCPERGLKGPTRNVLLMPSMKLLSARLITSAGVPECVQFVSHPPIRRSSVRRTKVCSFSEVQSPGDTINKHNFHAQYTKVKGRKPPLYHLPSIHIQVLEYIYQR